MVNRKIGARKVRAVRAAVVCAAMGGGVLGGATSASAARFMVVGLPDTQNYSEFHPAIFTAQTTWVNNNWSAKNMKFATHYGDIVNDGTDPNAVYQWVNARNSMNVLEAGNRPYSISAGNHDVTRNGSPGAAPLNADSYNYWFGKTGPYANYHLSNKRSAGNPSGWFGDWSPSGKSSYQYFNGGGIEFLHLNIGVDTPVAELAWAQGVLNANRDKPVMVTTHKYLQDAEDYTAGVPIVPSGRYPSIWYSVEGMYDPAGIQSEEFWQNFVRQNKQIFWVNCGHFHEEFRQVSTNNYGLPVQEVLADYQDDPNGGNGWMRLMTFDTDAKRVEVDSFRPDLGSQYPDPGPGATAVAGGHIRTASESKFTVNVDFNAYRTAPGVSSLSFQQGVSGYTGTQDTYVHQDEAGSGHGNSATIFVDNDEDNNPFGDFDRQQGLLRFDNIVGAAAVYEGDPTPTAIPAGATVTSARLVLQFKDDVDIGDEDFFLYRMTRSWDENSTWNSLSGGLSTADYTTAGGVFIEGDNEPNGDPQRVLNVKDFVQGWVNGTHANHGWAIMYENSSNNDDGIEIASSEDGNVIFRPKLEVEFTYNVLNRAPVVTQALTSTALTVIEGSSVILTMGADDANPVDPLTFRLNGQDVGFATGEGSISRSVSFYDQGVVTFSGQVLDDEATVEAGSVTITVLNAAPSVTSMSVNGEASFATVYWNSQAGMAVTAIDPGINDVISYAWDIDNDGQFDDLLGDVGSWVFGTGGFYPVTVRVSDNDNGVSFASMLVEVIAAGDADFDNDVDFDDLGMLLGSYGAPGDADWDRDGAVDFDDLGLLLGLYGFGAATPGVLDQAANDLLAANGFSAAVPEPSTVGLAACGAALGLRRRRR